jgi:hypothetical protein
VARMREGGGRGEQRQSNNQSQHQHEGSPVQSFAFLVR